ncbi:anucleate primary sterigmata protein B [Ascosphaera apis ARSEF 7405]|uniref:Anucleate primary sterigmata protein B n=1 Tax=Ascosphaera apis ARSEF 7405 TaxID=392613 RepID=A0A167Y6B8_9EURO|nr:anucleate primary sterigmata protein B [Ascosphaera apis ARSEF 7405]
MENSRRLEQRPASQADTIAFRDVNASLQHSSNGGDSLGTPQTPQKAAHSSSLRTPLSMMTGNMRQDHHLSAAYNGITTSRPRETDQPDWLSTSDLPGPMTPGASKAYELNLTGPARHSILRAETQLTTTSAGAATAVSASARASAISTLSVPASPAVAAIATSNQDSAVQDSAEILASATQQHEVAHTDSFCSSFYAPSASDNTSIAVNVESQLAGTPASLSSCQCEVLGQSDGDEGMDSKTSPACKNQANVRQESPAASHGHDFLEENDMQRRLLDMDSSFLPEPSLILSATDQSHGADDTYVNGVEDESFSDDRDPISVRRFGSAHNSQQQQQQQHQQQRPSPSPRPETGKTEDSTTILVDRPMNDHGHDESGSDEAPSNKHTETADSDHAISPSPPANGAENLAFRESPGTSQRVTSGSHQHSAPKVPLLNVTNASKRTDDSPRLASPDTSLRRRPKLLQDRQASNRLSMSSTTTDGTTPGDLSTPFDLVMQSGGVAPVTPSGSRLHKRSRSRNEMSRTTSLGSIASSISGFSDDHLMPSKRDLTGLSESSFNLQTLDEEREKENELSKPELSNLGEKKDQLRNSSNTASPSGKNQNILGSNKDSLKSSGSLESKLHEGLTLSPHVSSAKRNTSGAGFPRTGKALTLKEQSSTIDRLSKENFDLKMRIHFLSEALDRRSEEGIKEMISENVELNSAKLRLQKDNQALRKKQKELEAALKEKESGQEGEKGDNQEHEQEFEEADRGADDEELLYLRERIDTYEDEIERLRNESIMRESERRRLAEIVKAIGNDKGAMSSDAGAREERDMWKDMLGAETAAREQAEDENKRLRYEILRLKGEPTSARGSRLGTQSVLSRSTILDRESTRNSRHGKMTADQNSDATAEIELLRQENAELRREVSAQTSMLTSRNREKERLYQEIEELKLHQRRDGNRSIGDDSILERSISRTGRDRAMSRTSGDRPKSSQTPPHFTDAERESLETKNGELRDQVSALKIENQNSRAQFEQLMAQMESYEQGYQADMQSAEEEMQALIQERDQAYASVEEHEIALQDLRNEAQDEIDALGDELEEKYDECERLETELRNQQENLEALQAEIRSANEGINRLEEDAQANLQKYKNVQAELDDANRELESLEKSLYEANRKVETLTVQQESSQNEIAFLREEQESDKIRIGDFEAELKTCQIDYQSERDRARELEIRLIEEREQREAIDNQEKQEVQRAMNELNRELSTTKDEARKLKKSLSAAQLEATTWKERLFELEQSLRETLGDLTGSRSSLIMSITKIQRELEQTALELENTRANLDEKETLLRNRDALLESHALETRKLADLLDRERQAHRADKHSFEQALKSHQQASRTITQNNSRITDLEAARSQERRRFDGARRRLQESNATNEELKAQLEKQQPLHDYDQDGYQHRSRQGELNMLDRAVITSSRASRIRNEDAMDGRGRPAYENDLRNKHTSSSRRRHNSRDYRAKLDYDDTNDGPGSTIEG